MASAGGAGLNGLVWSMRAEHDRALLTAVGEQVGTPVVFLKGAFAEPVLYGNRGERTGCDLDILVAPAAFHAFADALRAAGYVQWQFPTHPVTNAVAREWAFKAPAGHIDVDLHRALADAVWYGMDTAGCIARARHYPVVGAEREEGHGRGEDAGRARGEVLALAPEDQVLFAVAHYAHHCFCLEPKGFEDTRRLVDRYPIAWALVRERARAGGLDVALDLFMEALAAAGVRGAASDAELSLLARLRRRGLAPLVAATAQGLRRPRMLKDPWDALVVSALASTRPLAVPRFFAQYAALRTLDRAKIWLDRRRRGGSR